MDDWELMVCRVCEKRKRRIHFPKSDWARPSKRGRCDRCAAQYMREKYRRDPVEGARQARERRKTNPSVYRESHKRWYIKVKQQSPEILLLMRARRRARQCGLAFDLTMSDVSIPRTCPVLGIPLYSSNMSTDNSPSLDRIHSTHGYVRGNVIVVSQRANRIKNDATLIELKKVYMFYRRLMM